MPQTKRHHKHSMRSLRACVFVCVYICVSACECMYMCMNVIVSVSVCVCQRVVASSVCVCVCVQRMFVQHIQVCMNVYTMAVKSIAKCQGGEWSSVCEAPELLTVCRETARLERVPVPGTFSLIIAGDLLGHHNRCSSPSSPSRHCCLWKLPQVLVRNV